MIYWSTLSLATEFQKPVWTTGISLCLHRRLEMQGTKISMSVVQPVTSDSFVPLSACMCFDCSDYKLSTAGTVCYQIYTHKWAKWCLSEWVFQGHHKSVFQAAQFESFRGLLESLYLSISYPMRIQLPLQKLVCCPLSVNTVRSQSWLSLTKEVQEILPLLFNWHHWCFNKVISWMQQSEYSPLPSDFHLNVPSPTAAEVVCLDSKGL